MRLVSEALDEIEPKDNVLVIRRIHVRLMLAAPEADWEAAGHINDSSESGNSVCALLLF
jgi:hypothetical protein